MPAPEPARESAPKRRKSLLGAVAKQQQQQAAEGEAADETAVDRAVQAEMERFDAIRSKVLAQGTDNEFYEGSEHFNVRAFWAAHKSSLPIHFHAYVAEVACKKAAAANVETVFSGAGKFSEEAKSAGPELLSRMVRLHYNWKYVFLRPTIKAVVARYFEKYPSVKSTLAAVHAARTDAAMASSTATATAAEATPVDLPPSAAAE